jgi:hypothetical protein
MLPQNKTNYKSEINFLIQCRNVVLYVEYVRLFYVEIFSALSSQNFIVAQNSHKFITIFSYM